MAVPHLPDPVNYAIPAFVALVLAEMFVARMRDRKRFCPRDTLTSLGLGLGSTVAGLLTASFVYAIAMWVYQFRIFTVPFAWYWFVLAFVLDDLAYYAFHRAAHRVRWFWASHVIHHSSQHYNLTTALRQTWTGFISASFIFRLPLFLLGFHPVMIFFVAALNLIYQFWIHTEVVGRMPGWFEAVMNTPSHHRVHHATNPRYLDKNYAGVFIVWDRMFGTFVEEREDDRPRYGIVKDLGSFNLLWAAFHEWIGIARDVWSAPDLKSRIGYMVAPPGWSHDGSRDTSEIIKARWEARQKAGDAWKQPTSSSIGGDPGGSALAGRLSEGGKYSVAVLESGGRNTGVKTRMPGMLPFQPPANNWAFETVPQRGLNGRRGYQPRGRGLGGSSAINAMLYVRGHHRDYDEWRDLGCPGWGWDDMLPWFRKAEHNVRGADAWHGDKGPLWVSDQLWAHPGSEAFIEAAGELQIPRNPDFNGAHQSGAGLYQVTQRNGERWSAARAYLDRRDGLEIITDAMVERVLFEEGRVWGVAYQRDGQAREIRARRAVVLAAGAFQTPQLLMLSGIGPGEHLREMGLSVRIDRPAVGGNLQDHVDYTAAFETTGSFFLGRSAAGTLKSLGSIARWMVSRKGRMTTPYAEAGAFLRSDPALDRPDIQLHFLIAIVEDHGRTPVPGHGFSCHACVLRPESRGTVRLQSLDPRVAPLIDPDFLGDPRDMDVLKRGVRTMYRVLEAPQLAQYKGRDRYPIDLADDAALERLIRARADTIYHPVGTARMGSDEGAVVTPRLKVRGVEGLYISDASIMPRLIGGNTNAPSIVIGERCAQFIMEDLGS